MSKKERARMGHLEPCEGPLKEIKELVCSALFPGLSLRAGSRGFSPATKRVAPGYFYSKIEEK